ncbi:hypothetical protein [Streptomyces sp. NPDC086787]|uniref:hypothetical protein n=1 Tax=Streptomyces sp. NPDC086787 TaxID=3365759 RepID=UPI0037F8BD81
MQPDRDLVAQFADSPDGGHRAIALLLTRHWRPTCDYAVICLASATGAAQLVATTAFNRVLARAAGGWADGALRPRFLVAVRETVREWAADDGIRAVLPELGKPVGGRGLRVAMARTPERRQLAERAFQDLSVAAQCLLWHTEVEAEPISVPAGLLGMDNATAAAALGGARERLRAGLDRPDSGGAPGEGGLGVLIADAVLGWGARRYLASRPGCESATPWPPVPTPPADALFAVPTPGGPRTCAVVTERDGAA